MKLLHANVIYFCINTGIIIIIIEMAEESNWKYGTQQDKKDTGQ